MVLGGPRGDHGGAYHDGRDRPRRSSLRARSAATSPRSWPRTSSTAPTAPRARRARSASSSPPGSSSRAGRRWAASRSSSPRARRSARPSSAARDPLRVVVSAHDEGVLCRRSRARRWSRTLSARRATCSRHVRPRAGRARARRRHRGRRRRATSSARPPRRRRRALSAPPGRPPPRGLQRPLLCDGAREAVGHARTGVRFRPLDEAASRATSPPGSGASAPAPTRSRESGRRLLNPSRATTSTWSACRSRCWSRALDGLRRGAVLVGLRAAARAARPGAAAVRPPRGEARPTRCDGHNDALDMTVGACERSTSSASSTS